MERKRFQVMLSVTELDITGLDLQAWHGAVARLGSGASNIFLPLSVTCPEITGVVEIGVRLVRSWGSEPEVAFEARLFTAPLAGYYDFQRGVGRLVHT